MSNIELYWDNDQQTVMLCTFAKGWTWAEMFETLDTIKKVTDQRDYEIGAIVDVSRGISVPGGSVFSADTREKAKKMLAMGADGKGPIAIVGAGGIGAVLRTSIRRYDFDTTGAILTVIIGIVLILELLSSRIRAWVQ